MKKIILTPIDSRKSFYGKAIAIEHDNGIIELKSYDTIVAKIVDGVFYRLWNDYSATTMRHINAFIDKYNISGGGKKWLDSLEVIS